MCRSVLLVFVDCMAYFTSSDEKGIQVAARKRGKNVK